MGDYATVTGTIGAITGVIALAVSIKNYARVSAMKALDLRLELNRAFDNLDLVVSGIDGYLDHVHRSHLAVFSATGRLRSGEMEVFEKEFESDKTRLCGLLGSQPRRSESYSKHTPSELESILTSVHAFHVQLASLHEKYQRIFESDEERRKEIRAKH